jgi:translation initiation factor IF-2
MSGDVQCVEVSAKQGTNLDKLEEAIILQSELLELKANPDKNAQGVIVEAKLEQGRGSVATVLIQSGTLRVGDVFVAGAEFGKVRALINDQGKNIEAAIPGQPVEVLGLNGTPDSGEPFNVTNDESKAREISEYRQRKKREAQAAIAVSGRTTIDDLLLARESGEKTALPVIVKGDVHGSVEAILGSFQKMADENEDILVQALHTGVGGITESDVKLAQASGGIIIGFNVRANAQARDLAQREGVDIRYYSVIYDVIDDAKSVLSGMLSPAHREEYLGQALIKQVFKVSKVGNVAGCEVTLGVVKRGSGVRLLRDDVVVHEGTLKTLQRFKDEVKEVKEGTECGMAFEGYDDIKEGDVIECYEVIEEARTVT